MGRAIILSDFKQQITHKVPHYKLFCYSFEDRNYMPISE